MTLICGIISAMKKDNMALFPQTEDKPKERKKKKFTVSHKHSHT